MLTLKGQTNYSMLTLKGQTNYSMLTLKGLTAEDVILSCLQPKECYVQFKTLPFKVLNLCLIKDDILICLVKN